MTSGYKIGQRIRYDGFVGTVRFLGAIPPTAGTWLGVEWDDVSRGKHSGEKDGVQYFTTGVPGSGSFIRPSTTRVSVGRSFGAALKDRYLSGIPQDNIASVSAPGQQDVQLYGGQNFSRDIEVVGLDKTHRRVAQLDRLREVGLENVDVGYAGEPEEYEGLLSSATTLDLSLNLLSSICDAAEISSRLPKLKSLLLNGNRFSSEAGSDNNTSAIDSVAHLHLARTLMSWKDAVYASTIFTGLRSLNLAHCLISSFALATTGGGLSSLANLEELDLDSNDLSDWNELITTLSNLPAIRNVFVSANQLCIDPTHTPLGGASIKGLRHLNVARNPLKNWRDLDVLATTFPALQSISVAANPFASDHDERASRLLTIARLPLTLSKLENSEVRAIERREADMFYWSVVEKEEGSSEEKRSRHRRFDELKDKLGSSTVAAPVTKPNSLRSKLITLQITTKPPTATDLKLSILPSTTVRILRARIAKLLKKPCPKGKVKLFCVRGNISWEFEDEGKELEWIGVGDGDQVEVDFSG